MDGSIDFATKLIPYQNEIISKLDPKKKHPELARENEYLALLYNTVGDSEKKKKSLAESGHYYGLVGLKTIDTKKETKIDEAEPDFEKAISLLVEAKEPKKALGIFLEQAGIHISYERLSSVEDVTNKILSFLNDSRPEIFVI